MRDIIIDDFLPHQNVKWQCDNCEEMWSVTAQYKFKDDHITLCSDCLLKGVEGIVKSYTNPKSS